MPDNRPIEIVRAFCAAWSRRNLDEIMSYFADDAVYHNIPMEALHGADVIRAGIGRFVGELASAEFELKHVAANGDVVLTERIDRFLMGSRTIELPVMGAFELRGDKIAAWRDYFDLPTFQNQMQG